MATNVLECEICNEAFDDHGRRPRILPCSHSLCSCCLSQLINIKKKTCPFCREDFVATTAEDLLLNRKVLDITIKLADQGISYKQEFKAKVSHDYWQKDSIAYAEKQIADCLRRETILQGAIRDNKTLENELLQRNKKMIGSMMKHLRHQWRQNKTFITSLRENRLQLDGECAALIEEIKELEEANVRLVNAIGYASVGFAMEQINQICNAGEERSKTENELILTNEKNASAIMKMQYKTEELAGIFQNTFIERVDDAVYITVNSLLRMNNSLKRTVEQGRLLAFQDRDGVRRYGRIRLESGNKICLSHLREEEKLPSEVHLIKQDHIMERINSYHYQAFLELGISEVSIGRMVIKLYPEGYYSKNFLLMCAGIFFLLLFFLTPIL